MCYSKPNYRQGQPADGRKISNYFNKSYRRQVGRTMQKYKKALRQTKLFAIKNNLKGSTKIGIGKGIWKNTYFGKLYYSKHPRFKRWSRYYPRH